MHPRWEVISVQVFEANKFRSLMTLVSTLMRQLAAINTRLIKDNKILFTIVSPEASMLC